MPIYTYTAIDPQGRRQSGQADADNIDMLEARLGQRQLVLIRAKPKRASSALVLPRGVGRRELIHFCFQMEQMVNAGVGLLEGLHDYADSLEAGRFRDVVAGVADKIESGMTFSEALAQFPQEFPELFVNLVMAGEQSGELGKVLGHLTESLKWQDEMISRTRKALSYPLFVAVVVMGVVSFMMIYVVPQITQFIVSMGGELPWHTRLLIAVSNGMANGWPWLFGLPVVTFVVAKLILKRSLEARRWFDAGKLRLWVVGPVLEKIVMARFAHYFTLLFQAGLPVLQCIELCTGVVGNLQVARILEQARSHIAQGESVSEALAESGLFPRLVVRLLKVGERSGDLGKALSNVNYFYQRDVDDAIGRMQAMIEPALNIIIGAIMGWVMLSVLGPVYDMISKVQF